MKAVVSIIGFVAVLTADVAYGRTFTPPHFNAATASEPENPWAFYNVTFFKAAEGFGASYVSFDVQNNVAGQTDGYNYSTSCSAVAFPSDPINGGSTPSSYETGGVQGGCDNMNATWTWDGSVLRTIYKYGSGDYMPNGLEYICTLFGEADTNATTLATKTSDCGCAKVAEKIPIARASAVC